MVTELKQMRDFQKETIKKLENGYSPLIFAPTGIGKTKAALIPFICSAANKGILGTRLIYALPMRSLMKSVYDEFACCRDEGFAFQNNAWIRNDCQLRAVMHHGQERHSTIFSERVCVTTIDQVLTAFAGAPLSFSASAGHAVAGALHTSYLIFDEAHLLSGRFGLPMLFALLKLRKRWGLLSTVMTATLPDAVINFFCNHCGMTKVEATDKDIDERDSWREVTLDMTRKESNIANVVYSLYVEGCQQRIIVFMNTVERAICLYRDLARLFEEKSLDKSRLLLVHSRFTVQHRKQVEEKLPEYFGRESNFNGILVTTQVAEAGLNISANTVISELCPMDSLIQRAGRCARFKPVNGGLQGHFYVIKPNEDNWFLPYEQIAVEQTERRLNFTTLVLKWKQEKELVNSALGMLYESYLTGSNPNKNAGEKEHDDSNEK